MQRQYRVIDSFPETIETDQGSFSNNTGMSQRSSMNNFPNPVENRLSNDTASYDEASCVNAVNHNVQSFSGWNSGESSSRLSMQNQDSDDGVKMEERWHSSVNACAVVGPRSEERQFEPADIFLPGRVTIDIGGNQIRSAPSFLQGSSSNNVSPNLGYLRDSGNGGHGAGTGFGPNPFNSVGAEIEQATTSFSSDVGPSGSSGYLMEETSGGSGSSLGGWGLSCKRKAFEGTSGHSCPGGSSSCFPQTENVGWHTGGTHHNASSSLSLSPPSRNSPGGTPPELLNTRMGLDMRGVASDNFPSSSVGGNVDSARNSGSRRFSVGNQQESLAFNLSSGGARRSTAWSVPPPFRSVLSSDSPDFRSMPTSNSNASRGPLHGMQASASSRSIPFPWNGSSNSRAGNSSGSFIPGERVAAFRDELSSRSISRTSAELPMFVPVTEMRYTGQDPSGWSLATGNMSASASVSSNRVSPSSSIHPLPTATWFPHYSHPTPHNEQRFSEFAPWSLFPSMDSESGGHSGHFPPFSSGPSVSSQETAINPGSSGQGHNTHISRAAFLMGGQDDVLGMPRSLRALAADIEGRHRLISEIRQVLNAMRRGQNLRIEDYVLFDPFMHHGMADMHDRHRDMRLDVDNMSYEELLALEERIGDVSTGLTEGTILKLIKQMQYFSMETESQIDVEPCCICQEEYVNGDDLGKLECGHDFHTDCIKQWLMLKNLCPICKTTALPT